MTGNFNIHDSLWDSSYLHHAFISNNLLIIVDSFNLDLSVPTNLVLTRYSDNENDSNSVIDLMFLRSGSNELDNHIIHLEWRLLSDHAPLTITILIIEEHITSSKCSISNGNEEEEEAFIKDVFWIIKNLNMSNILDSSSLDNLINGLAQEVKNAWNKHLKMVRIMKHSKSWWDDKCSYDLETYRLTKSLDDWKTFRKTIKSIKRMFFDLKIQEIANKKQGLWELINWINKRKLPAIKTIKYNN